MKFPELVAFVDDYVTVCRENRSLSENTVLAYKQDLESFRRFCEAKQLNSLLDKSCVLGFLRHLREERRLQPATIRRRMLTIRAFAGWLHRNHQIAEFAFADLELELRLPKRLPRPIDHSTLTTLLSSSPPIRTSSLNVFSPLNPDHSTLLAMNILIATGIRIGELTHIRLDDISDGARRIRIRGKGNKERAVYIGNQSLRETLGAFLLKRKGIKADTDYLLLNRNKRRLTEQAFRTRLRRLSSDLGIQPHITPHRFRHSAATLLIEEGIDIRIVQRLLGHSSISTTEVYTYVSDASLMTALQVADPLSKLQTEFT